MATPDAAPSFAAPFYEVRNVPVNSVLLLKSSKQAEEFPLGDITLTFDPVTGLISNSSFDEKLVQYSGDYEETQGFSPAFNAFHERLARDLIDRFDLHGKKIVEIGCGKGEFLNLLCEIGLNVGVGYDPAYDPQRNQSPARNRIQFIRDFYSEKYAPIEADFVCCKMTLEHIPDVCDFVGMIRRSLGNADHARVFFQVPDARRILRDAAFWDIYYEHCSYFTEESLRFLFEAEGFDVLRTWTDYDDQYLMIEARPAAFPRSARPADQVAARPAEQVAHGSFRTLENEISEFRIRVQTHLETWRRVSDAWRHCGKRVALWGGGSKAVAFLTTLEIKDSILGAVDINPHKQGTYLAGTGFPVLSPSELPELKPDIVVIMNPVYDAEIRADLDSLGLSPEVLHLDQTPT